jgi:ABC-type phosphate/phosphonate transport system substrate-binding protein
MKPLLITFAVFLSLYRPVYANNELTLAVLPYLPVKDIMQKFSPLAEYLSQQTGKKVSVKVGGSFQQHINFIGQDKVDIAQGFYISHPMPSDELVPWEKSRINSATLQISG